eukprot:TRINITY_DN2633_c0_g1_i9.p1 TRINITY_DN2633_c0_g1~~TRINITY_DN2633_c0_g1_i9.p1  ORF type:complete len:126 (+),score=8.06 TRINITY_DN2633_c0_g1_i9:605-982(+)
MFVLRECVFLLLLEYVTCFQFKITSKEETFLDLSLDIAQNTSITRCLKNFSSTETLGNKNKFYCDHCSTLQEAQKRMKIQRLPKVLIIQLKRFKYSEASKDFYKLSHRVSFPVELRVNSTVLTPF